MKRTTRKFKASRPRSDFRRGLHHKRRRSMLQVLEKENEGLRETIHLLSNPANAKELLSAIAEADRGEFVEAELIEK